MLFDHLLEVDAHRLFEGRGLVDVAGDVEQLGAGVVGAADAGEPGAAAAQDLGDDGDRLDVVDGRRVAVDAHRRRERRLQPRLALLALERLHQRGLFAADVGAGAVVDDDVEVPAVDVVLADQLGVIGLLHRRLEALALADELAADVDVGDVRIHGAAGEQAALDEVMRIVPQDLAVLAGAGLGLVGVDEQLVRPPVVDLGHEGPLERGGEPCPAAAAQARGLDLVGDPVAALVDERPWCRSSRRARARPRGPSRRWP